LDKIKSSFPFNNGHEARRAWQVRDKDIEGGIGDVADRQLLLSWRKEFDRELAIEVIRAALDCGINFIDTGRVLQRRNF